MSFPSCGQCSAATPPSIQLSQGEKSIPNLIIFYTENSIKRLRKASYLREKLSAKLGIFLPLDKTGVKKLKTLRQELTEQNESLRPKLGQIQAELDQLSKLRYWTRKAIPDALPEREDFAEQMEVRENRRELEQVMDAAIEAVTQETDELQPMTERSLQEKDHDQER